MGLLCCLFPSFQSDQLSWGATGNLRRLPEPSNPSPGPRPPREHSGPPSIAAPTHVLQDPLAYLVGFHPHLPQSRLEKLRGRFPHHLSFDTTGILGKDRRTWHGFGSKYR